MAETVSTFFTVSDADINKLSPAECVDLFGDLLRADARRVKLPISRITISSNINIPDGGIDASVEGELPEKGDFIVEPRMSYQIKAGAINPWTKSAIEEVLFSGKATKQENLGEQVRRCFENGGLYVLVCMKTQLTPMHKKKAEENLRGILSCCGIQKPKVEVWGQDKILGGVEVFPSLLLRITGRDKAIFQSHCDWHREAEMQKHLVLGSRQDAFIKEIRTLLYDDSQSVHVNVYGETGAGKTRLVLEATDDPFLSTLVIYCRSPNQFLDSLLMNTIVQNDLYVILVIDDCDLDSRTAIWNRLKEIGPRIKLVTIHNEYDRTQGETKQIMVPNLDDDKIKEIILRYYDDNVIAGQLSRLCGHKPGFAHAIGWDAKNNPDELLKGAPDTNNIYGRYIRCGDEPESEQVKQRTRILSTISLFKQFGYGQYFRAEMDAVYKLVQKLDPNISLAIFNENIEKLKKQGMLKERGRLYLSVKGLHIWLWEWWWEHYEVSAEEVTRELPDSLISQFLEMLGSVANLEKAKDIVRDLFIKSGLPNNYSVLQTAKGSGLFYLLAMTDQHSATNYLEGAAAQWSRQKLQNLVTRNQSIIDSLERIIFEPDLFVRGGRILRCLAEAENEERFNSATAKFCSMFSLGPGHISMTKAPPTRRIPLLEETLCGQTETRRSLGLKACNSALVSGYFSRVPGPLSDNEIRIDQEGWKPETVNEWQESYQEVIELLIKKIKTFPETDQKKGAKIIVDHSRELLRAFPSISNYMIDKLSKIRDYVDKEAILGEIVSTIEYHKDELKPDVIMKLKNLQSDITGKDYSSLMKRYVGMDIMLDLAKHANNHDEVRKNEIDELADRSLDLDNLKPELKWLVTGEAKYGLVFGYELAKKDPAYKLMPAILDELGSAGDSGGGFFVSGYFARMRESDTERWESEIGRLYDDPTLCRFVPEITWRSGITDRAAERIIHGISERRFDYTSLRIFAYGSMRDRLSEDVFNKLVTLLLGVEGEEATFIAIDIFYSYYVREQQKKLPKQLALELLLHQNITHGSSRTVNPIHEIYWKKIGLAFVNQYPNDSVYIAKTVIENFDKMNFFARYSSELIQVLNKIAEINPREIWAVASRYAGPPMDSKACGIRQWLRGGIMDIIPMSDIIAWIDEDEESRLGYVASLLTPEFENIREFLIRYGKREEVQNCLGMNFSMDGPIDSEDAYYENKKKQFEKLRESETNTNVLSWLNHYIRLLDRHIKHSKKHK